jgi:hypothetical protein
VRAGEVLPFAALAQRALAKHWVLCGYQHAGRTVRFVNAACLLLRNPSSFRITLSYCSLLFSLIVRLYSLIDSTRALSPRS